MIRWLGIVFLTSFLSIQAKAIDAVAWHSVFFMPDSTHNGTYNPYIEVYWQINPTSVHFMRTPPSTLFARIKTDVFITNEAGTVNEDHFITETTPRQSTEEVLAHSIIDLHRYLIKPGHIKLRIQLTDATDTANHFTYTDTFTVARPDSEAFFSSIQLLDTAFASNENTVYQKNGYQQIPLCTNFIDEPRKHLRYYAELYQANLIPAFDYPLVQSVFISKEPGTGAYVKFLRNDTIKAGRFMPILGSLPIAALESGNYYINATLKNKLGRVLASSSTKFQRFNLHPLIDSADLPKNGDIVIDSNTEKVHVLNLNKTFIGKYSFDQVKSIMKMMRPVCDPAAVETINNFLKKPDELYMRYFIYNYFAAVNKDDPDKAWKEFAERVREVNKLFDINGTPGYLTDRGYVYLKYGPPDNDINVENEEGALPYQIWQYNSLKTGTKNVSNAVFLFYRPQDMVVGYLLLHSTVPGEAKNSAWRSYLYVNAAGGTSLNSRAEQYIGNR